MPLDLSTSSPLVGRAEELDRLARLVGVGHLATGDRAGGDPVDGAPVDGARSRSGAVLLTGDAGIGKTRLLTALGRQARADGWRVAAGHCLDFGDSALPYLPFSEVFGRLDADAPQLADAVARAHPAVTRLMPARRPLSTDIQDDVDRVDRTELFEAVHAALEDFGADSPLLLVFEDAHWADQSTRDLLSFLFARRFSRPVSLVVSYRGEDLHRRHPLRGAAAQWARLPGVERLELARLSDADVRNLIRLLHPGPLRESEVHTVVERAEGNAFFTEELVAATTLGHGALPRDLAGLLLVRLDQLDDAARHVVRVASAAGRGVAHDVLARVVELDDPALDDAVRAAVERNVLISAGSDRYAFRHAMLGEAVYDDLLPGERVRIHAAYVSALTDERVKGTAAELARHARAAHDPVTALQASIQAGNDAMSVGGPDEALRHYELALEIATDSAVTEIDVVVDLTTKASAAATASGHPKKAVALVQDQLTGSAEETSPARRVRLLHALATAVLQSDLNVDALAATTEALQLVPADPPTPLRCRVLSVHAQALADRGRDEDATRWADEALTLARRLGLRDVVAAVTTTLARIQQRSGDADASRAALELVIDEAHAAGDAAELRGLHHLGGLYYEQGRLTEALDVYQRGTDRAREIGRPWAPYGLDARVLAIVVAYDTGEWDASQRMVDVRGQSPSGMAEAALTAAGMSVAAGRGSGDPDALLLHVRPWWDSDGMIAILSAGPAIDLYGQAGDLEAAIAVHDEIVERVGDLWQLPDFQARVRLSAILIAQLVAHASRSSGAERAALARRGDDLAAAAERAARRSRRRRREPGPEAVAWAARVRAEHLRLRWLTGVDLPAEEKLVTAWQDSVNAFATYPHVFELARSQTRLAAVLHSAGDHAQARELTDPARATAHRLGAQPLLAELRALGTAARRGQERHLDEALTPREHEVLALVAQGRSNREIGAQLYISAKTVSVHVSNILTKLAVGGRTEAVAVARRRGLLTD